MRAFLDDQLRSIRSQGLGDWLAYLTLLAFVVLLLLAVGNGLS